MSVSRRTNPTCYLVRMKHYAFLLLIVLLPTIASAQETQEAQRHPIDVALDACMEKDPATAGMLRCTDLAYRKWDQELNKNYRTLMNTLKPAGKPLLRSTQLSWIAYRDKEFKLIDLIFDDVQGTMYIPLRLDTKLQIVKQRALALAAHIDMLGEIAP